MTKPTTSDLYNIHFTKPPSVHTDRKNNLTMFLILSNPKNIVYLSLRVTSFSLATENKLTALSESQTNRKC